MAAKPETTFITSVHRHLPSNTVPYRMKNHNAYIGGPADVWYSGNNGDIWVEYKYTPKLPVCIDLANRKKKYALSALQQTWLNERHDEGRSVFVILGFEHGGVIFEDRKWNEPMLARFLSQYTRQQLAVWICKHTMGQYVIPPKPRKGIERCV